ncbi:MAG: ComF family protein [Clostridia bacterium]|nr:ComF family protein [Clostridia bacterium]
MNALIKELLFSPRSTCLGCGSVLGTDRDWLCADCYAGLNPLYVNGMAQKRICLNCGEEYVSGFCRVCKKRKVATLEAVSSYEFEGAIRNLVHAFKFSGVWRLNGWMAEEMLKACQSDFLEGVTDVVPTPMHKMRRLVRGYNQSEKLAIAFCKLTGIPINESLKRIRNTKQQVKLKGEARRKNLTGAFECRQDLSGRTVLLIDDVRTTGSTAVNCSKTLLASGASEVRVLTFAQAVNHAPDNKKYAPDRGVKLIKPIKDEF